MEYEFDRVSRERKNDMQAARRAGTSARATDPGVFPEDRLDAVAEELDDRPRKTLRYRKSGEAMLELNDSVRSEPTDRPEDD
ncbi:hypothetical protein ACEWFX_07900 [Bifidobacterium longum subsp. suis]|uniref:hypothetical protein n=1 Tax=Bifidobacterium longum TaxID=216816 RepID=UPI003D06859D